MQLVGELPLEALGGLLSYAEEQEAETSTRPLWIIHYALSKLSGKENMPYDEFLRLVLEPEEAEYNKKKSTPEEIMAKFAPIIEADRKRRKEG